MQENELNEELLETVNGGYAGNESDVRFRYRKNLKIYMKRVWIDHSIDLLESTIADRGIYISPEGRYYACYYVEVRRYAGSGWIVDYDGVSDLAFENRLSGTPYKTGL